MTQNEQQSAFEIVVCEHLPDLLRFAQRLTGSLDQAEEVVQEALLRATGAWHQFRHDANPKSWLMKIVINTFRNYLKNKQPNLPLNDWQIATECDSPVAIAEQTELGEVIAQAIAKLPERQREVLVLISFEGISAKEVSALLELSVANVYSNLHYARENLQKQLAHYFPKCESGSE